MEWKERALNSRNENQGDRDSCIPQVPPRFQVRGLSFRGFLSNSVVDLETPFGLLLVSPGHPAGRSIF